MATKPGILTNWPWKPLGPFKYVILAPWVVHSTYQFIVKGESERDLFYFLIFPFLLVRRLHNLIWISLSRYRTAKGNNRIVDKCIEFEQVDRECNWDDQILLTGVLFYIAYMKITLVHKLPVWGTKGVAITSLLHAGPVEFLYYWFHRMLHHHYLYSRYHSHHHSSIVTEPITSVTHPFAEHTVYFMLFGIPLFTTAFTGTASLASSFGYILYIDFMNNMGHCNFELVPNWVFSLFPPLKYLMYTPSFHSLHHTKYRTNYSLFMPIYDYIYGTMDKSTDALYEVSLKRPEESPDVVHLTHLTTPDSIYHLRLGFASLASRPHSFEWYLRLLWPLTLFWYVIVTWIHGHAFVLERTTFKNLKLHSWVVPRYRKQYKSQRRREVARLLNSLIEEAILDAELRGVKVLSLGLQNQGEELNANGELYIQKFPQLKVKLVDGSSLAVAVVLNSIPKGTTQVMLRGNLTKVAYAIAEALCENGIQVAVLYEDEYNKLKQRHTASKSKGNLVLSTGYADQKMKWLVGDGWVEDEQLKASKGTLFIPFSQFPPKKLRKDCFYHSTPAMIAPTSFENMHSCENWLPRRAMSAWRIAGILHALEGWNAHECGSMSMFNIQEVWEACLRHGFQSLTTPA